MSSLTQWDRFVRYVSAKDGKIKYGEPMVSGKNPDIDELAQSGQLKVKVLEGSSPFQATPNGDVDEVKQLLGPLTTADVPIIRCIGLNYRTHSALPAHIHCPTSELTRRAVIETGFDIPANPTLFYKPGQALGETRQAVPIPKLGQPQCDYEGELTVVVGKDCKNVSEDDALSYVAGYVSGNDISCRDWQMEKDKAGMMPQWGFSKSFDKYAPIGPCITSTKLLGDGGNLSMKVYVNGELRQDTNTSDLVFGVKKLISHLSTGQTLQAGSLIMVGFHISTADHSQSNY